MRTQPQDIGPEGVEFPSQGTVMDLAGMPVDARSWIWRLNTLEHKNSLNFQKCLPLPSPVLQGVVQYMADRLKLASPAHVSNAFQVLCLLSRSKKLATEVSESKAISPAFFVEMRGFNGLSQDRLHHVRHWYRWCAMRRLPYFSTETAASLDDQIIGGNEKGRAVRTRDPLKGAFDDIEHAGIVTKLRAHGDEVLTLLERALVWLFVAFGRNPYAYALMREEDYRPLNEVRTDRVYHRFNIPQIKQGYELLRSGFDPKMLNQEVGGIVAALVKENTQNRTKNGWPDGCAFPLFPRRTLDEGLFGGPMHEFAMHLTSRQIRKALQIAIDKLELTSHRTGEDLKGNPRRFRYTFATRMVAEGASPTQLAIGLGHTDLQNVNVYYETRPDQVERLDAALAVALGPIADAFMGRIVDDTSDVVNGTDPAKRIPHFRRKFVEKSQPAGDLGVCGSGPCHLFAPVSCYTCAKFQPWRNGPHREVLDWLVEERERKQKAGLDPQIYKIHDATILAIGKVVAACEENRE